MAKKCNVKRMCKKDKTKRKVFIFDEERDPKEIKRCKEQQRRFKYKRSSRKLKP